jgi:hypothetical protein
MIALTDNSSTPHDTIKLSTITTDIVIIYNVNGSQTHLRKYPPFHLEIGNKSKNKIEANSTELIRHQE